MSSTTHQRLRRDSSVPLYVQIEHALRDLIEAQHLQPGDRVPSEIELSERHGVSRMTARKAIDRLALAGVLYRRQGKGTFVASRPIAHGLSTKLSFSAAMDALGKAHRTVVLVAASVPAPPRVADALDTTATAGHMVRIQRVRHVEDEPVALHDTWLTSDYVAILDEDLTGSLTAAMTKVGATVTTARDVVSATLADDELVKHLDIDPNAPILRISSVGHSASGVPLRYTEAHYRGDRFTFDLQATAPSEVEFDIAMT